ncbi:MAG: DUF1559 domain-containing protein [Gemmataceae bacterium]|nr:DUF1559 domain-containing protein [Gemmataceae bacterium]
MSSMRKPFSVYWLIASMLLPTVPFLFAGGHQAQEAREREEALKRFQKIAVAIHYYHEENGTFPPAALVSKDGQKLLSWRVLLLPYLGDEKLFREFRLTESWDSPHNKKLLAKIPKVYSPLRGAATEAAGATSFQVFTGPHTLFEGERGSRIQQIRDGTSNTILLVEAAEPVPWTKPVDLPFDPKKPLPKLGAAFKGRFLFATADGAAHVGKRDFDEGQLRWAIMRNDGMSLRFESILAGDN